MPEPFPSKLPVHLHSTASALERRLQTPLFAPYSDTLQVDQDLSDEEVVRLAQILPYTSFRTVNLHQYVTHVIPGMPHPVLKAFTYHCGHYHGLLNACLPGSESYSVLLRDLTWSVERKVLPLLRGSEVTISLPGEDNSQVDTAEVARLIPEIGNVSKISLWHSRAHNIRFLTALLELEPLAYPLEIIKYGPIDAEIAGLLKQCLIRHPNIHALDMGIWEDNSAASVDLFATLPDQITKLKCYSLSADCLNALIARLPAMTRLRKLDFHAMKMLSDNNNAVLKELAKVISQTNIQELDVSYANLTNADALYDALITSQVQRVDIQGNKDTTKYEQRGLTATPALIRWLTHPQSPIKEVSIRRCPFNETYVNLASVLRQVRVTKLDISDGNRPWPTDIDSHAAFRTLARELPHNFTLICIPDYTFHPELKKESEAVSQTIDRNRALAKARELVAAYQATPSQKNLAAANKQIQSVLTLSARLLTSHQQCQTICQELQTKLFLTNPDNHVAATIIQAHIRGFLAHRAFKQQTVITHIQAQARGWLARRSFLAERAERERITTERAQLAASVHRQQGTFLDYLRKTKQTEALAQYQAAYAKGDGVKMRELRALHGPEANDSTQQPAPHKKIV